MVDRPILFSAPMVRAILDGRKTQTRRVVKPQPVFEGLACTGKPARAPYGFPGDTLWVRESVTRFDKGTCDQHVQYRADGAWNSTCRPDPGVAYSVPSIFMPRWASRISLRITDVRVERLRDCSAADAKAEGLTTDGEGWWVPGTGASATLDPVSAYAALWEHINGPGSWDANPWVWAVSFERVT